MVELISKNRERIAELCRTHHVRRLAVFGSAARGTDFDAERSDVDLLVEFEDIDQGYANNYFSLMFSFDELFGREVDIISDKYIWNPYLRREIDADKVILYGS